MKKSFLLIITELVCFSVLFVILPALVIRNRFSNYNLVSYKIIPILAGHPIKFDFIPQHDQLNSLSFQLKNPNLLNHDPFQLTISDQQGTVLQSITFSGANVGDPSRLDLKFTPLRVDTVNPIHLTLSTQSHDPNQLFISTDDHDVPVYFSTFKPSGVINSILYVVQQQKKHLQSQPILYLVAYISLIILLNLVIIKNFLRPSD